MSVTQDNIYVLRGTLLGGKRSSDRDQSKALDPFENNYEQGDVLRPPYDPEEMALQMEGCDVMPPILDALRVNIEGHGYTLQPVHDEVDTDDAYVSEQWDVANDFLRSCSTEGMTDLRFTWRDDLTLPGNGYIEVLRETAVMARARKRAATDRRVKRDGDERQPYRLVWLPAYSMRICRDNADSKALVPYMAWRMVRGRWTQVEEATTFRKFVQQTAGGKKRYFKEVLDPRTLDCETGKYTEEDLPVERRATEVWHTGFFTGRSAYGISKFAPAAYAIGGLREAEKVNYLLFENKTIPPLLVMVSGGVLTTESFKNVEEAFEGTRGVEHFHSALILEAKPHEVKGDASLLSPSAQSGQVKITVKPLTDAIQKDALFLNYIAAQQRTIRGIWRVPPILMGLSDDYSYATATVSLKMFEDQVCKPERRRWDNFINQYILPSLGVHDWVLRSEGIKTGEMNDIADLIRAGVEAGAGDPNIYGRIIGEQLGMEFPRNEDWDGVPFDLTKIGAQTASIFNGQARVRNAEDLAAFVVDALATAGKRMAAINGDDHV